MSTTGIDNYWTRRLQADSISRRRFVAGAAIAGLGVAGLGLVGCGDDSAGGTKKGAIKIGWLTSLTGLASVFTQPELAASKLAVKEINERGGVLGKDLQLIVRDDQGKPDVGTREARSLIEGEGSLILMGTISSGVLLAVSEYAKSAKVPFVVTEAQTVAATVEKGHQYVFRTIWTNTQIVGRAMAKALSEKKYKKWYMIGPDYEYGHSIVEEFWSALKKFQPDAERLGDQWPKLGAGEYSAQINAILSAKPDAVFTSLWGGDAISFIKQAKGFNYFEKVKHTGWTWGDLDTTGTLGADYPEGVFAASAYQYQVVDTPENTAFVTAYHNETGNIPTSGAAAGYTGVYMVAEALKKAGAADREKFVKALEGLQYNSVIGKVTVRACDHQAYGPVFVGEVKKLADQPFFGLVKNPAVTPENYPEMALSCEEVQTARKG